MNEEKAIAILLANIKKFKNKPSKLTDFAKACEFLINKNGLTETAKLADSSEYQLKQITKINELSPKIKKIIDAGKLGIDSSYQIWRLNESIREQVAKESIDLTSHEVRQLVHLLLKNKNMTIKEAKDLTRSVLRHKFKILSIPLTDQTYDRLSKIAKKKNKDLRKFITEILENHVN